MMLDEAQRALLPNAFWSANPKVPLGPITADTGSSSLLRELLNVGNFSYLLAGTGLQEVLFVLPPGLSAAHRF